MKEAAKRWINRGMWAVRRVIPLSIRRNIVAGLSRMAWVPYRDRLAVELLRDFADKDPNAWHRFLWTHHLAYAESYSVDRRFGSERIAASRLMLFEDLRKYLVGIGVDPENDIASVFEVGSSLGYLLRHLETGLFRSATVLEGIDIDRQAVEQGAAHLAEIGSKAKVSVADMSELPEVLAGRMVDVILCAGVLMYLRQDEARDVVRSILDHTTVVAAFAGLADPSTDNATLSTSTIRANDGTYIHNIDAMVDDAGGQVAWRRWEGPRMVDGNTIYFVFALPAGVTG
jgi:SAM-dependent methyltransferase